MELIYVDDIVLVEEDGAADYVGDSSSIVCDEVEGKVQQ